MTSADTAPEVDPITDALRHVLLDAFSLQLLALCAAWNIEQMLGDAYLRLFQQRARTAMGAAHQAGLLLRRRGAAVALHPSDPSELPRWMFAAPVPEPMMLVGLLAQATGEFVVTLEAALDVAAGQAGDAVTHRSLTRRLTAERRARATLEAIAASLAERPPQLHS
jgi:hypothetical protein